MTNRKKIGKNTTSEYIGVHKRKEKFTATLILNRKTVFNKTFLTELEAAIARDKVAIEYHGEFAYLNFPDKIYPSTENKENSGG